MRTLKVILPKNQTRLWHAQIVKRITEAGLNVQVELKAEASNRLLDLLLTFEKRLYRLKSPRLADYCEIAPTSTDKKNDLVLNLSPTENRDDQTISITWSNHSTISELAALIAAGKLPNVGLYKGDQLVAVAHPMIDNRQSLARGLEDVLARTISLIVATITSQDSRNPVEEVHKAEPTKPLNLLFAYCLKTVPRLAKEAVRRTRFNFAHWRVGYRFIEGSGVAETGDLSGANWNVLQDDGKRFYADPFAFNHQGKDYIFVEDYPHDTKKALISVSTLENGIASQPRPIIEEAYHLSYPQVFQRDDQIWMIPEASAGGELVLYRAKNFPHEWERHAVLKDNCHLSDATLLEHDDTLWLFATDTEGHGSTSDMLVVLYADSLQGPWIEHPANPIIIDRASARPGGAFIQNKEGTFLPVQDGTLEYGGGLGLAKLTRLTKSEVRLERPAAISANDSWPYPKIHTLNRSGALEVIDGIAEVRKS